MVTNLRLRNFIPQYNQAEKKNNIHFLTFKAKRSLEEFVGCRICYNLCDEEFWWKILNQCITDIYYDKDY